MCRVAVRVHAATGPHPRGTLNVQFYIQIKIVSIPYLAPFSYVFDLLHLFLSVIFFLFTALTLSHELPFRVVLVGDPEICVLTNRCFFVILISYLDKYSFPFLLIERQTVLEIRAEIRNSYDYGLDANSIFGLLHDRLNYTFVVAESIIVVD